MSGEEEAQRGAIEKVGESWRTDAGEVMEDDGEAATPRRESSS
jgi:hypothetical protein